jgi:hypothetical protein
MKLKAKELEKIANGLAQTADIEMLQRTAYFLTRINDKITSELRTYNESRSKLEEKYGQYKADKDKATYTFKADEKKRPGGLPSGAWYDFEGKKVENFEPQQREIYWKANSDEDMDKYLEQLEALGEAEIDVSLEPIKLSELVNGDGRAISIKPRVMAAISQIITEG